MYRFVERMTRERGRLGVKARRSISFLFVALFPAATVSDHSSEQASIVPGTRSRLLSSSLEVLGAGKVRSYEFSKKFIKFYPHQHSWTFCGGEFQIHYNIQIQVTTTRQSNSTDTETCLSRQTARRVGERERESISYTVM